VQNYLVPPERLETWKLQTRVVSVATIGKQLSERGAEPLPGKRLLVNFSGCANPFAPSELFERYVSVLTDAIVSNATSFKALGKPFRFLLPHNYSQALMSEHYSNTLGPGSGMAFSRFGPEWRVHSGLLEEESVARVTAGLSAILNDRQREVRSSPTNRALPVKADL
jgi:hypothetical protein